MLYSILECLRHTNFIVLTLETSLTKALIINITVYNLLPNNTFKLFYTFRIGFFYKLLFANVIIK